MKFQHIFHLRRIHAVSHEMLINESKSQGSFFNCFVTLLYVSSNTICQFLLVDADVSSSSTFYNGFLLDHCRECHDPKLIECLRVDLTGI